MIIPYLRQDLEIFRGNSREDGSPAWLLYDAVRNKYFTLGLTAFKLIKNWKGGEDIQNFEKKINLEGIDNRWKRHIKMAQFTRQWALDRGQSIFTEPRCKSNTITCIRNDRNWDINKINEILLSKGYRMDRGYGKLRFKAFRIAHMGNVTLEMLEEYLDVFDKVLYGLNK